jgi:hypothetical protein
LLKTKRTNLYWLIHTLIKTLIILNILAFIFIERLVLLRFIYWYLNWSQNISFLLQWFLVIGMLFFPVFDLMLNSLLNTSPAVFHYKISQFSQRTYSIVVWLKVCRWFIYRQITSVGFTFFGDSPFRPHISRQNKKTFANGFTDGICAKKKDSTWNIPKDFYSVGDILIYRRLRPVGKSVSECMKYPPSIFVCKLVGKFGSYCQMLTD